MTRVESAAMSDDLLSRFLRYVPVDTQPDETSNTFPSTPGQLVLLEMLKHELSELGASDVEMTKDGYVMASIPANTRKARVPTVAFFAHVDTAPDCSGHNVKPILHRRYNGRVMKFPDNPHLTLDPAASPELRSALGNFSLTPGDAEFWIVSAPRVVNCEPRKPEKRKNRNLTFFC